MRNSEKLPESKTKYEIIKGTGHAPFVERTALVYEKLRIFLSEDKIKETVI
jgi:hypothetical protein